MSSEMADYGAAPIEDMELPKELSCLVELVESRPESFATGDDTIQAAALDATRYMFNLAVGSEARAEGYINGLLNSIKPEDGGPVTRSKAAETQNDGKKNTKNRGKRSTPSASPSPPLPAVVSIPQFTRTPLQSLYMDGMNADQIWAQLELRTKMVCEVLTTMVVEEPVDDEEEELRRKRMLEEDEEDENGDEELSDEDMEYVDGDEMESESEDEESEEESDDGNSSQLGEGLEDLRPGSDEEDEDEEDEDEGLDLDRRGPVTRPKKGKGRPAHPTLDDGFFSIDEFNRETEQMEALSASRGKLDEDSDDSNEGDVSEHVDFSRPVDDGPNFEEEDEDEGRSNPFYRDFFAPPPRAPNPPNKKKLRTGSASARNGLGPASPPPPAKSIKDRVVRFNESVRVKNIKSERNKLSLAELYERAKELDEDEMDFDEDAWGEGGEGSDEEDDEDEEGEDDEMDEEGFEGFDAESDEDESGEESADESEDGLETMERLKDDLFAEDEDEEGAHMSTHEKRMADLAEQIASLETENVGPKDWTLMGEASARGRPQNSLLEEDLEYERSTGKAAPVITEESIKSLEDLIKGRIMEGRYDDVVRRREEKDKPFLPSRMFELEGKQSARSLAQIYEDEYTAAATGDSSIIDDRDGKLAKEHQEIERIWGEISYKLDALCNVHFTPKQPKAVISTISNIASTSMESALPTTASTSTLLAPEEILAPKATMRSKSELTPQEKRAARTKERKTRKKQRAALDKAVDKFARKGKAPKNVKEAKSVALEGLVKNGRGITVVGKEKAGVKGGTKGKAAKKAQSGRASSTIVTSSGHSFKL